MIEVRRAETDADLEAWARVKRVVLPDESAWTPEQFREHLPAEWRALVAAVDGEIVGCGLAGRSDQVDRVFVAPRVLPEARRRGVGTELLRELVRHVETLGAPQVGSMVDDPGSRAFGEKFGFRENDRQVQQVKTLGHEPPPVVPDGVELFSIADRPELLREAFPLGQAGYEDLALDRPRRIELDEWLRDEASLPGGSFVALADGEIVGYSGLMRHDNEGVAEDGMTVVRRDWRRRGLGLALKRTELVWAADNGFREVVTWTQRRNEAMRAVNEQLGYEYRTVSIMLVADLPLERLR